MIAANIFIVESTQTDIVEIDYVDSTGASQASHFDVLENAIINQQKADCILVLGASVLADGSLSAILQNRVDAAIELYNRGISDAIVMSGYGIPGGYNEPYYMKQYAISKGVDPSNIYCDDGGNHTYDSLWRTKHVFEAQTCVVVSQEYHLARAVFDGKALGMTMLGVISDHGVYDNQRWYDLREAFARLQDFIRIHAGVVPEEAENPILFDIY
ncbi:MAG: YdcF family protein [Eggerthellaceae bacterium]|nr:YdcF family protein [Eggerthellaceae bacterium]